MIEQKTQMKNLKAYRGKEKSLTSAKEMIEGKRWYRERER